MVEKGRTMFISRGGFEGTLFHDLYEKGLNNEKDYKSYKRSSYDNPLLDKTEIDDIKNEVPESTFRQHINADFLSLSELPIPNIDECATAQIEDFYKSSWSPYVMGLDLAKHNDYTVITVGRRGHIVYFERFNKLSWPIQEEMILSIAKKYNAEIIMDSTGIGDVVYDHLLNKGLRIEPIPYNFSEASRKQLLDMLILRMSYKNLSYPDIPVIKSELKSMRWVITRSGKAKLKVPGSKHDDCIFSIALCNWGMSGILNNQIDVKEDVVTFGEMVSSGGNIYLAEEEEDDDGYLDD